MTAEGAPGLGPLRSTPSLPDGVDAFRALGLSIRGGNLDATRHDLARVGPDAEFDPDACTPLIRAVVDAPPSTRPALVVALREAGASGPPLPGAPRRCRAPTPHGGSMPAG